MEKNFELNSYSKLFSEFEDLNDENIKSILKKIEKGDINGENLEKYLKSLSIDKVEEIYDKLKNFILSNNFQEKNLYIKGFFKNEEFLKADWGSDLLKGFYVSHILYMLEELTRIFLKEFKRLIDIPGMDYFKMQLLETLYNDKEKK